MHRATIDAEILRCQTELDSLVQYLGPKGPSKRRVSPGPNRQASPGANRRALPSASGPQGCIDDNAITQTLNEKLRTKGWYPRYPKPDEIVWYTSQSVKKASAWFTDDTYYFSIHKSNGEKEDHTIFSPADVDALDL